MALPEQVRLDVVATMTCIVGIAHEGNVYIGGDRSAVDGWNKFTSEESKVFRVDEVLIGTCGSHLVTQAMKYELELSRLQGQAETDMHYLVTVFAKEVRKLIAGLTTKRDDDGEAAFSGGALFGYRGNLYRLSSNCQVDYFNRRFDAIGSGAPFALGAVAASGLQEPVKIIHQALRIASELCCDVWGPIDVEVLTSQDSESTTNAFMTEVSKLPNAPLPRPAQHSPSSIRL